MHQALYVYVYMYNNFRIQQTIITEEREREGEYLVNRIDTQFDHTYATYLTFSGEEYLSNMV